MIFLFCIGDPFQHDPFAEQPPAPAGNSPFDDRTDVIQMICSQTQRFLTFPWLQIFDLHVGTRRPVRET